MKKTLRKLEMLLHSAIIALLLLRCAEIFINGLYYPGIILLGLSASAMCISLFWKKLKLTPKNARLACYYLEAPAFMVCWLLYKLHNEPLAAQACLMAAVILPFFGYISTIKTYRTKKRAA